MSNSFSNIRKEEKSQSQSYEQTNSYEDSKNNTNTNNFGDTTFSSPERSIK